VVFVSVLLDKIQGMAKVLDRLPRVVSFLIAFQVHQEFISLVLVSVIEYLLCFPFFCIIDNDRGGFAHCNDPTIGSYNNYHLSPNGIRRGSQRRYGLVYLVYKNAGSPKGKA